MGIGKRSENVFRIWKGPQPNFLLNRIARPHTRLTQNRQRLWISEMICFHCAPPDQKRQVDYLAGMTGMHEFAEFCAGDIGTVDSGLNSIVLASNSEMVRALMMERREGGRGDVR